MLSSIVTSKGQITIPAKLRKHLGIKPSDRVNFQMHKGALLISKKPDIDTAFGALHNPKVKPLTTKEMSKLIDEGLFSDKYKK